MHFLQTWYENKHRKAMNSLYLQVKRMQFL